MLENSVDKEDYRTRLKNSTFYFFISLDSAEDTGKQTSTRNIFTMASPFPS